MWLQPHGTVLSFCKENERYTDTVPLKVLLSSLVSKKKKRTKILLYYTEPLINGLGFSLASTVGVAFGL